MSTGPLSGPASGSPAGAGPLAGIDLAAVAGPGAWLELSVAADHEAVEAVSEILSRAAPGGTSVEPAFTLVDEGLGAQVDVSRPAIVRAALPLTDAAGVQAAVDRAELELGHLQAFGLRPDRRADGARRPRGRLGERVEGALPRAADRTTDRDPADVATASSASPTTWCSPWIPGWPSGPGSTRRPGCASRRSRSSRSEARSTASTRVLDVGSGSGILAIAAALLGAREVLAVDVDPIAVQASRENARRNRLARVITAREGSVPTGDGPFELVLANLIAGLLVTLADPLVDEVRPGGTLLASGIFHDREAQVVEAFESRGLDLTNRWAEGDWVALELTRPA